MPCDSICVELDLSHCCLNTHVQHISLASVCSQAVQPLLICSHDTPAAASLCTGQMLTDVLLGLCSQAQVAAELSCID